MDESDMIIDRVAHKLQKIPAQVASVLSLVSEGATVPFISRYRREQTGGLDENDIRSIIDAYGYIVALEKLRANALSKIQDSGLLTDSIRQSIEQAQTQKEVEDIYQPFRLKKQTKSMLAVERGFAPIADFILRGVSPIIPSSLLSHYSRDEIIDGAIDILIAQLSSRRDLREPLCSYYMQHGSLKSKRKSDKMLEKLNQKTQADIPKFDLYADTAIRINRLKSYQILALNRGENLGILRIDLDIIDTSQHLLHRLVTGSLRSSCDELDRAIAGAHTVLCASIERYIRDQLTSQAEDESIATFRRNLAQLLLTKPEYGKHILAVDPGYRSGCKIAILDTLGNPLHFSRIYLHQEQRAKETLSEIAATYTLDAIIIGNGTASQETVICFQSVFSQPMYLVDESGASVYSASAIAQEEFPDLDATDRGTVSLGRRYIDPLSELVKIPVGSIGVGMYQHDIAQKKLEERLSYTVEDVIHQIGVQVNTASVYVLMHISGIDKRSAKKIYAHRPFESRSALKKILSEKAYQQSAGFLRIAESENILDNTDIHPEQYALAHYIIENQLKDTDFDTQKEKLTELYPGLDRQTLRFIITAYQMRGVEARQVSTHVQVASKGKNRNLCDGDIVHGVVRNVLAFGAFVDIGEKHSGLVHISQITDKFIQDPLEYVSVGQSVQVRILRIDPQTGKIQLTMRIDT